MAKLTNINSTLQIIALSIAFVITVPNEALCDFRSSIEAENLPIGNVISWANDEGANEGFFIVQKSMNAIDFFDIAKVEINEDNLNADKFHHLDRDAGERNFYRVKKVANIGYELLSEIYHVRKNAMKHFIIKSFTVDHSKQLSIDLISSKASTAQCFIKDRTNKVLKSFYQGLKDGENNTKIDLSNLIDGIYHIDIEVDGKHHRISLDLDKGQIKL